LLSRGTTLAALVLTALAAPVTAFALSAGPDTADHAPSDPAATHAVTPTVDDDPTEAADPDPGDAGTPNEASVPGRAHAAAMQEWAHCVAEAASGPKTADSPIPPKTACDLPKPLGPGRAKHAPAAGLSEHGNGGEHGTHGHIH